MNEKFIIAIKMKSLITSLNEIIVNYPRSEFVLKDRVTNVGYDILELIYLANTKEDRLEIQKEIIVKICMLDFYLEVSYNKKIISVKKLKSISLKLNEIKKLTYGWVKSSGS